MADPDIPGILEGSNEAGLPAGDFSSWLAQMQAAIRGEGASEVPCRGCTACCRSSQFIHIGPDEIDTLARIPSALLSAAPRLPAGTMVLGYDDRGHCPMLIDDQCSIYEHRPRACRAYDCRIFAATGAEPGPNQELIARRTKRWRFAFPRESDHREYGAVRAAAGFVERHPEVVGESAPVAPNRLAAAAVAMFGAFLDRNPVTGAVGIDEPDAEQLRLKLGAAPPEGGGPVSVWPTPDGK
jgi:Fe-S-cluster containining protein